MSLLDSIGIEYRQGKPEDALCIGVLAMQVFLNTYAIKGINPDLAHEVLLGYTPEAFTKRLENATGLFFLAERAGHLVAFAEVAPDSQPPIVGLPRGAELVHLYVQHPFKGCGIGKILLDQAEAWAVTQSAKSLWLAAWAKNVSALGFYAAHGYTDQGATPYIFQNSTYENRILTKSLA